MKCGLLRHVKAKATKSVLEKKKREGLKSMRTYLQSETAQTISHLQPYLLVFCKDRCVRKIHVEA
jgi:hypothetical protein